MCNELLEDAVVIRSCQHYFCSLCIAKVTGRECPECDRPFQIADLEKPGAVMEGLLRKVKVKCIFDGCNTDFEYSALKAHQRTCRKNPHTKLKGHTGVVKSVAWSKSGDILASGSSDNKVIIWDHQVYTVTAAIRFHYLSTRWRNMEFSGKRYCPITTLSSSLIGTGEKGLKFCHLINPLFNP